MSIQRTELSPGYPVLEIEHPAATARVALHGAHLMEWQPAGQAPMLYLSPQSVYQEGKAIRGGVPVCWPWFGAHESDRTLPSHGFARTRFWTLAEEEENESGVRLLFTLTDDANTRGLWPHPFRLELEMLIGRELHLALRMQNTGTEPFTITGALHTYLAVGDIREVRIEGLDGAEYLDTTGTPQARRQEGDVVFAGEVDRNYSSSATVKVRDAAQDRILTVRGAGSECTVVWNPWIAKARALTDLPDDDYLHFVCVETANAWRNTVVIPPGESHTLETTVSAA
jgi:glucose-6-phosphate 1-epimerase